MHDIKDILRRRHGQVPPESWSSVTRICSREPPGCGTISDRETPGELAAQSFQKCNYKDWSGRTPGVLQPMAVSGSGRLPTAIVAIMLNRVLPKDI